MQRNENMDGAVGIILAGHAPLPEALLQAATTILGGLGSDLSGIVTVTIGPESSAPDTVGEVGSAIEAVDIGKGALVLADLFGGSAANSALAQLDHSGVEVVTGASLAMVIEAVERRSEATNAHELAAFVAKAGRGNVIIANALLGKLEGDFLPNNQVLA